MKKIIASVGVMSLLTIPVVAAESADVTATVTVENITISVADGAIDYGTIGTTQIRSTAINDGDTIDDSQTATNDGNVSVDLNIRGTDTDWTLGVTAGDETYRHDFCISDCDGTPTWVPLTTTNQPLASGVATSTSQVFDLRISTPTVTTTFTEQAVTVTVQASAS